MRLLSAASLLLALICLPQWGFAPYPAAAPVAKYSVRIDGTLSHCELDSMRLFVPEGTRLVPIQAVSLQKEALNDIHFAFELKNVAEGFYYVGGGTQSDTRLLLLGSDPQIEVEGQCHNLRSASVRQSSRTDAYYQLKRHNQEQIQAFSALLGRYRQNLSNPVMLQGITEEMARLDQQKLDLLDSLGKVDPFLHKVFALQTYISYQNHGAGIASEGEYFAQQFFQFADLRDPVYERIPHVFEAFQTYATTLGQVGLMADQQLQFTEKVLKNVPTQTLTHRMALLGLSQGYYRANTTAFLRYAERYVADYGQQNPAMAATLRKQIKAEKAMTIGAVAPEIALPTPEGDTLRLSDLRGKVVLIDFWASWCGPCRRENPNVVRLYKAYKDQGFEIYGVSLDASKAAWLQAIEKDGLVWQHVSDLRRWQSVAAQTYGVSSIPATVLIGRDGRIIARNLRGELLENKLAEVMGNG